MSRLLEGGASGATLGVAAVATAAVGYGATGPLSAMASAVGVSSIWFVAGRALIGGLVLGLAWRSHTKPGLFRSAPRRAKAAVVCAGLLSAAGAFFIVAAINRTSIAIALLVYYTYPVVLTLGAGLLSRGRLSLVGWVAIIGAMIGVLLVVGGPNGRLDPLGIAFAVLSAACGASFVLLARYAYLSIPAVQAGSILLLVAGLAAASVGFASQALSDSAGLGGIGAQGLGLVVIAGVATAAIPTWLFVTGVRMVGAARAAVVSMIEPVAGVLMGALLVGQIPTELQFAGGALVIVGSLFARARASAGTEHVP